VRLLFITQRWPCPPRGGGLIKTWALVRFLEEHLQVEVVSADSIGDAGSPGVFPRPRGPGTLLASYAAGLPLSIYRNWSPALARAVLQRLDRGVDAVLADHIYMAQYVPDDFPGRKLLHLHNVESLLWRREAALERSPLRRWAIALEARRLRRYEEAQARRFDRVFAVSEEERRELLASGLPEGRTGVLANVPAPDLLERPPLRYEEGSPMALYLGTLSWRPNERGLRAFLPQGLPALRRRVPQATLTVAGGGAPRWLAALARSLQGLHLRGPVDDAEAESLYRAARAFVEPVLGGAGTKVKVLNALARGLPVVATPDGARGLEVVPGRHLLLAEGPEELAEAAASLLGSPSRWQDLSEAGRELVRRLYVPEVAFRPLLEELGLT
jgi:glycosyltransferase involved in cell wall biosynthesis